VQCVANAECPIHQKCDDVSNKCVAQCTSNSDCSGTTPFCNNGFCVQCLYSGHCDDYSYVCDVTTHTCSNCIEDASCDAFYKSHCRTDGKCVPCQISQHCARFGGITNKCHLGVCTQCDVDDDCLSGANPRCNEGRCAGCNNNNQCAHIRDNPLCSDAKYCRPDFDDDSHYNRKNNTAVFSDIYYIGDTGFLSFLPTIVAFLYALSYSSCPNSDR
jgi:hypothetical protein